MLEKIHNQKALQIVQHLFIVSRTLAYNEAEYDRLADLLDRSELLPALILDDNPKDEQFIATVKAIINKYPECSYISSLL